MHSSTPSDSHMNLRQTPRADRRQERTCPWPAETNTRISPGVIAERRTPRLSTASTCLQRYGLVGPARYSQLRRPAANAKIRPSQQRSIDPFLCCGSESVAESQLTVEFSTACIPIARHRILRHYGTLMLLKTSILTIDVAFYKAVC